MSVSFGCHCPERRKPAEQRRWVILQYRSNHSAFNGYRWTASDYSDVACLVCHAVGRTKAAYVEKLKIDRGEWEKALRTGPEWRPGAIALGRGTSGKERIRT